MATGNPADYATYSTGGGGGGGGGFSPPGAGGSGDAEARAALLAQLQRYGIEISSNIRELLHQATANNWSSDKFNTVLRQTPEYSDAFPGNTTSSSSGSTTTTSESTYQATADAYRSIADSAGIDLSSSDIGSLFRNNVSPDEFAARAPAYASLRDNEELFSQFKRALVQEGAAKGGDVTDKNMMDFVMGQGNAAWTQVWNLSRARYQATQVGIKLNKAQESYLSINPGQIEKIAGKGLSDAALAAVFGQVATNLGAAPGQEGAVLTLSEAKRYGITKRDILAVARGGKNAQAAKNKISRVQKTYAAAQINPGSAQATSSQEGGLSLIGARTQQGQGG